jgi:hypothetical protein
MKKMKMDKVPLEEGSIELQKRMEEISRRCLEVTNASKGLLEYEAIIPNVHSQIYFAVKRIVSQYYEHEKEVEALSTASTYLQRTGYTADFSTLMAILLKNCIEDEEILDCILFSRNLLGIPLDTERAQLLSLDERIHMVMRLLNVYAGEDVGDYCHLLVKAQPPVSPEDLVKFMHSIKM